jgi:hypothetical protein
MHFIAYNYDPINSLSLEYYNSGANIDYVGKKDLEKYFAK